MDGYSSKRGVMISRAPRKGYIVGSSDANSAQDQSVQFCNRRGCHGRIKYGNQNMKTGICEKAKTGQSSFCSLNRNGMIGTSAGSGSVVHRGKRLYLDSKRQLSSQLAIDQPESSQSDNSEATRAMSSPDRSPASYHSGSMNKSGLVHAAKAGRVPSSVGSRKRIQDTSGPNKQNTRTTAAVSSTSKSPALGTLNSNRSSSLKNLNCSSISDAAQPSCSSSQPKSSKKNTTERSLEGDSGVSDRGRQTAAAAAATFGGYVSSSSSSSASTSDSRRSSCITGEDSSASASSRTGESAYVSKSRMRHSNRHNGRNISCYRESAIRASQYPDTAVRPRLSPRHFANASTIGSSSYSLSSRNDDSQFTLARYTSAEHSHSHLVNLDMLQQYSMDDIARALPDFERLEQLMTREQTLALENSLYLSGLNLYDQHRDMRLDIDEMSYEELLALGDRMGTVSTALSEEELLKCVERSIYQVTLPDISEPGQDGDDVKCSICQEDYIKGDEIGKLMECKHAYHVGCIDQWLGLKNWCPICKTTASPPHSSSSS